MFWGADIVNGLWDDFGHPCLPPPFCPDCDLTGEITSHFDDASCKECGWSGSLTELHECFIP